MPRDGRIMVPEDGQQATIQFRPKERGVARGHEDELASCSTEPPAEAFDRAPIPRSVGDHTDAGHCGIETRDILRRRGDEDLIAERTEDVAHATNHGLSIEEGERLPRAEPEGRASRKHEPAPRHPLDLASTTGTIRPSSAYTLNPCPRANPTRVMPYSSARSTARLDGAPTATTNGMRATAAF